MIETQFEILFMRFSFMFDQMFTEKFMLRSDEISKKDSFNFLKSLLLSV
jgi:hypothetical protein